MASPLLKIDSLSTIFHSPQGRVPAVHQISFQLNTGQSLALVGESGCGKSVSALSIMRLVQSPPGEIVGGEIFFQGRDLLKLSLEQMRKVRGKEISMIFQEPMTSLNPIFKVGDQIAEAITTHFDISQSEARERTLALMAEVGIPEGAKRYHFYPHEMSGGLRQRIMIAMALSCQPKLLIADEPTTALDVSIQAQILKLIKSLQEKRGMSLILITHDLGIVETMADQTHVMYAGQIVESGATSKILSAPEHPYTRALQHAIPDASKRGQRLFSIPFMVPSADELLRGVTLQPRWAELNSRLEKLDHPDLVPEVEVTRKREFDPSGQEVTRKVHINPSGEEDTQVSKRDRPLLNVEELKVYYPVRGGLFSGVKSWVRAVDGVSFQLNRGERIGLVGESGCGKSTVAKALVGLVPVHAGRIAWKDSTENFRRQVQMIFQDPFSSLNPRMKVGECIGEVFKIHRIGDARDRKDRVLRLLKKVGLRSEAYEKYPHMFSGGQRQRVGIARALAVEPKIIIADEPVSALDVSIQAQILNLLSDLQEDFGLSFILISHDLNVVRYWCNKILVMNQGKLEETLSPEELESPNRALKEYTRMLLDAVPKRNFTSGKSS